jgi:hypothetical protein
MLGSGLQHGRSRLAGFGGTENAAFEADEKGGFLNQLL